MRPRSESRNEGGGSWTGLYRAHPHGFHVLALLVVMAAAFAPALGFDFVWDDQMLIVNNQQMAQPGDWTSSFARSFWDVHDAEDRSRSFYRPVVSLSYRIDRAVWGLDPQGFHLTNLVLYALGILLVHAVGLTLLESPAAAFLGALVYTVLPVHVENVAWISGRTDLLCAVFLLVSYLLFLTWLRSRDRPLRLLLPSAGAYLAALLSKEMAITLPLLLVATWWLLEREAVPFRRLLAPLAFYLGIAIAYLGVRAWVLGDAVDAPVTGSPVELLPSLAMVFTKYVRLLLLLASPDPHHPDRMVEEPLAPLSLLYLLVTAVFLVWLVRRVRRRDPVAFAPLWFVLTLLPVFNLGAFGDVLLADRFLNIPSVGWALLVGVVGIRACRTRSTGARVAAVAGVGAYLVLCGASLRANLWYWASDEDLFARAAETSPDSAYVHMNLARGQRAAGKHELALRTYDRALALDPEDPLIHLNKGVALEGLGRTAEALGSYLEAHRRKFRSHTLFYNIGNVLKQQGRCAEAVHVYARALELRDDYRVRNNLGECLLALGELEAAERQFRLGLERNASHIEYNNLGMALSMQGERAEAIRCFRKAIELDPDALSPRYNLARTLYLGHEIVEAGSHARMALELLSRQPDASRSWPHADRLARLDALIRAGSYPP